MFGRRSADHERVRHYLRGFRSAPLLNEYGEEIVRLRGAIKQAADILRGEAHGAAGEALALLEAALDLQTTATRRSGPPTPGTLAGSKEVARKLGR